MTNRPVVRRVERWPVIWAAICITLLVALAASFIAYLHATAAINCTNDALGTRQNVGKADAVVNTVLQRPSDVLVSDSDVTRAVLRALNEHENRVQLSTLLVHGYVVLDANQKYRAAHPLGTCG